MALCGGPPSILQRYHCFVAIVVIEFADLGQHQRIKHVVSQATEARIKLGSRRRISSRATWGVLTYTAGLGAGGREPSGAEGIGGCLIEQVSLERLIAHPSPHVVLTPFLQLTLEIVCRVREIWRI